MVNVILISHGRFCEGLLDSLRMIGGDDFGVKAVPLFPGDTVEAYREKLEYELKEASGEGTLVLADIKCGTPYQSAAYLSKTYKMALVTGMNLPMLLSAVLERDETDTLETISARAADNENYGIERTISGEGVKKQRAKLSINKS